MSGNPDGDVAAPDKEDRLLLQLQSEQRKGCERARALMDDYREYFDGASARPLPEDA
jgi:hypothetical protein